MEVAKTKGKKKPRQNQQKKKKKKPDKETKRMPTTITMIRTTHPTPNLILLTINTVLIINTRNYISMLQLNKYLI